MDRPDPLDEGCARVQKATDALSEHRETLTLLLTWEIGKPGGSRMTGPQSG